ncbi:hypothetical protein [Cumulibacter soli]|uniref:hypothetical protein n=1 Tax=Cumulibacter soli TaxID=2546344 RepID=UPI0010683014|nr:hypothetical protein [Cumulibacter soli]
MEGIVVAVIGGLVALTVGYWQFVYKPKRRADEKTAGERALDEIFAETQRLRELLEAERTAHRITTQQYLEASTRLASVEAQLVAARQDVREKDEIIESLRSENRDLRIMLGAT